MPISSFHFLQRLNWSECNSAVKKIASLSDLNLIYFSSKSDHGNKYIDLKIDVKFPFDKIICSN